MEKILIGIPRFSARRLRIRSLLCRVRRKAVSLSAKSKQNIMNGMQLKAELLYEVSNMEENPQLLKKALACIREICGKSAYHTEEALIPYTLEELNMRAAEAEEAYRRGECLSAEEVDRELEEFMRRL